MKSLIQKKLILASQSPRRSELLKGLGLRFEIRTKPTSESFSEEIPVDEVAGFLSNKKAMAFAEEIDPDELVIAADTLVIMDGSILGKPQDEKEAAEMLKKLSGSSHRVVTGVTIMDRNKKITFQDITKVYFKSLSQMEINHYILTSRPFDKAGAYGIQEWIGYIAAEKIEGSYYTVMGLPVHRVYEELKNW